MANQLKIYLNVNEVLMKNIRKGSRSHYLEVTVDGRSLGRIGSSQSFYIENGHHNVHLCYHYGDTGNSFESYVLGSKASLSIYSTDFTCHCDFQCFIDNDDFEETVNVYFATAECIDFIEGNVPFDMEKAKPKKSGCYIATCVYGSYDCPQVWTLRRYRDDTLRSTWYGRAFIRTYYAISPTLVKWFGHTNWFKRLWKGKLDRMVKKLQENGVKDTPYNDNNS